MTSNLRQARTQAGGRQTFVQYVCCPKCCSIYPKEQCVLKDRKGNISCASCSHVRFPAHPQHSKRLPCGTPLMKQLCTCSGNIILRPYMVYCYKSLIESLQMLLLRPNFFENYEKWRLTMANHFYLSPTISHFNLTLTGFNLMIYAEVQCGNECLM